jgi:hypothetical protein
MTDAEVVAMSRGTSGEIARRIARHSPTKPLGRLVSSKAAPPRISAAEMRRTQQAKGRLDDRLRHRLQNAGEAEGAPEPKRTRKASPVKEPPAKN